MKIKGILVVIGLLFSVGLHAQSDTYTNKVKEYMQLSGGEGAFKGAIKTMISQVKSSRADIPTEFWDEFEKEFLSTSIDDLVTMLSPIYKNHLTEEDLDGIIKFYKSPVGKKLGEKTSLITQESMVAGQQWGMQISQKIINKLQEKGY